jgi:hypothetical protein
MQSELRPIDSLRPDPRNARTHPDAQLDIIEKSIREFGWTYPILHDDHIRAGHGRLIVAKRMLKAGEQIRFPNGELIPLGQVPVMDCTGWSEAQRRAYMVADNKIPMLAEWNETMLGAELRALLDMDFDATMTGFDMGSIEDLLRSPRPPGDPDTTPAIPANPVSRTGDIWTLGRHRVICGDCTDPAVIKALWRGKAPEITITDPPYGIGYEYAAHDDSSNEANAQLVADAFKLGPKAKVWTPGLHNLARDIGRFGDAKTLVWHKGFAQAGNGLGGASTWEPVLVIMPKRKKLPNDYLDFKTDREELGGKMLRKHHPCPKPVALFVHLIECLATERGTIHEPFGGSGTTLIAAEMAGRICGAVEIFPGYVDVILQRWEAFTGEKAVHAESGELFADRLSAAAV